MQLEEVEESVGKYGEHLFLKGTCFLLLSLKHASFL